MRTRRRVVVIGAGMVGVCCALWLQRRGHEVWLVDGNAPGMGASWGNACTIAVHGCVPINRPGVMWRALSLLRASGPLSIDARYAITHWPWFLSFIRHCTAGQVASITAALGQILRQAHAGLTPLIDLAQCAHLLRRRGCLYAYETQREYAAEAHDLALRRRHGVQCTELNADEIRELEPNLKVNFARGVLFDEAAHVVNPHALVGAFFECFRAAGGHWQPYAAEIIHTTAAGIEVRLANREHLSADKVVLAAGAFSTQLPGAGAHHLPLDVERGYHVQFGGQQHLASRPVCWAGRGFYATPTTDGLRFAGGVEMAGLTPQKNPKILAYLTRMARRMFALPGEPEQTWLGYRPTMPDALPVIGAAAPASNILYAFGHNHLGITLAGITGQLIAQLIDGEPTAIDLAPFSAARFSR